MASTTSPNMNLPIPGVGTEAGPTYGLDINSSLTLIDMHDHSPGKGAQITTAGLNINSALVMNTNAITGLKYLTLVPTTTPSINTIYESGVDLFYVDGLGNNIRITQSGGVVGAPGNISGLSAPASAAYVSGSKTFVWQSGTSIAANMDIASLTLRNITPNSTFGITLQPPASLSSNSAITLPNTPGATGFMQMDTSGVITAPIAISHGLTSANYGIGSQIPLNIQSVAANYTAVPTDGLIQANTGPGGFTVSLYTAAGNAGLQLCFKKTSADSNVLTIDPNGSETIDGQLTFQLIGQYDSLRIVSDGTNWKIIESDIFYIVQAAFSLPSNSAPVNTWKAITGNSITISPGTWEVNGFVNWFGTSNASSDLRIGWFGGNGDNTGTTPAAFPTSGVSLVVGKTGQVFARHVLGTSMVNSQEYAPKLYVTVTQSVTFFLNAFDTQTGSAVAISGQIIASRIR